MSRHKPNRAINASCLVALLLTLLLAGWLLPASAGNSLKSAVHNPGDAQQLDSPVALIKSIIVAGPKTPTTEWDVAVQRADSTSERAQAGTFLYGGDRVITH